jgi:nucleoside 2-deoxyribosyltransferase
MKKLIYLAGAMTKFENEGKLKEAIMWRKHARDALLSDNFEIFNPTLFYEVNKNYNLRGVPYQNLYYLEKSDIILLNAKYIEFSPGTMWEIFLSWYNKKPVICFGHSDALEQPHIKEAITIRFDTLDNACEYIKSMYCQ